MKILRRILRNQLKDGKSCCRNSLRVLEKSLGSHRTISLEILWNFKRNPTEILQEFPRNFCKDFFHRLCDFLRFDRNIVRILILFRLTFQRFIVEAARGSRILEKTAGGMVKEDLMGMINTSILLISMNELKILLDRIPQQKLRLTFFQSEDC